MSTPQSSRSPVSSRSSMNSKARESTPNTSPNDGKVQAPSPAPRRPCRLSCSTRGACVSIFRLLVCLYDLLTYPVHLLFEHPWNVVARAKRIRATRENLALGDSPYYRIGVSKPYALKDVQTLPELQKKLLESPYAQQRALGFRPCLEVKQEFCPKEKKKLKKFMLEDYTWLSAVDVDKEITLIEIALKNAGVQYKDNVLIFSETRYEWFLSAHAILRLGAAIVTLFPNLSTHSVNYGINDTNVSAIFTSLDLIERIPQELPESVSTLVYFPSSSKVKEVNEKSNFLVRKGVQNFSFDAFRELGRQSEPKSKGDASKMDETLAAMILYTSGSTGVPKGVVLTHRNFLAGIKAVLTVMPDKVIQNPQKECWYGYLPLAHILELIAEMAMFSVNIPIGYGSPFTMTDLSTGLARGCKGDMSLLKPTIMPGVPLVVERIRRQITDHLDHKYPKCSPLIKQLIQVLVDYKNHCLERGVSTPIMDRMLSPRFKAPLGGHLGYMLIGGAPLSCETHRYIRALLNVRILIGYGASETCGANLVADLEDISLGWTGAPLYGVKARLVDWPEAGYSCQDRPYPRGELHIGGGAVSIGYYNQPKLTQEEFYVHDGVQWFKTGDVAQVNEQGVFKIIDRKKDLVKLQHGEYVSLGKIETELKNWPLAENVCVYADSKHTLLVAIFAPANAKLLEEATKWSKNDSVSAEQLTQLCGDDQFIDHIAKQLQMFCSKKTKLTKLEIPQKVIVAIEEWTPDNELITASLKIRRHKIYRYYKKQIDAIYSSSNVN